MAYTPFDPRDWEDYGYKDRLTDDILSQFGDASSRANKNRIDKRPFQIREGLDPWAEKQYYQALGHTPYTAAGLEGAHNRGLQSDRDQRFNLSRLQDIAQGELSFANKEGLAQKLEASNAARSQASTLNRSRYNAGVNRQAISGAADQRALIDQSTQRAALAERQGAAQMYNSLRSQEQQQAQQAQSIYANQEQAQRQHLQGQEQAALGWAQLGQAEKLDRLGSRQESLKFNNTLKQGYQNQFLRGLFGGKKTGGTDWGGIVGGGLGMLGGLAAMFSDERAKELIGSDDSLDPQEQAMADLKAGEWQTKEPKSIADLAYNNVKLQAYKRDQLKELEASKIKPKKMGIKDRLYAIDALTGGLGSIIQGIQGNEQWAPYPIAPSISEQIIAQGSNTAPAIEQYSNSFMSDERAKKSESVARDQLREMLSGLTPYRYKYKDEAMALDPLAAQPGVHVGVMAQDLERSKLGKRMVEQGPGGYKEINANETIPVLLAAVADLNRRLNQRG